jgi:Arc/MetJ family transcription regulator
MRTTINIDDELLARVAKRLARLARLGGTQPALKADPRRRPQRGS